MTLLGIVLGLGVVAALLLRRRSHTKNVRAGLDSARPQFFSDPPQRRHHDRSREAL